MARSGGRVFTSSVSLALLALALLACRTPPGPLPARSGPYGESLLAWSRQAAIYEGLEARVFVAATLHAPAFRAALGEEVARLYGSPEAASDAPALVWASGARGAAPGEMLEFLVALTPADRGLEALDGDRPAWRLTLTDGAGTRAPISVERIEPDVTVRALYPYLTVFAVPYRVRFAPGLGPVKLTLAGAHGRAELEWPAP